MNGARAADAAGIASVKGMIVGKATLTAHRGDNEGADHFGEADEVGGRVGSENPRPGQNYRPLGRGQFLQHRRERIVSRNNRKRLRRTARDVATHVEFRDVAEQIHCHADQHRAWRGGLAIRNSARDAVQDVFGLSDTDRTIGDQPEYFRLGCHIDLLEGIGALIGTNGVAGDHQHRRAVVISIEEAVEQVAYTGSYGRADHRHLVGDAEIRVGGMHRELLIGERIEDQPGARDGIEQADIAVTAAAEDGLEALSLKKCNDRLPARHCTNIDSHCVRHLRCPVFEVIGGHGPAARATAWSMLNASFSTSSSSPDSSMMKGGAIRTWSPFTPSAVPLPG